MSDAIYKMYVWRRKGEYVVMAHATSVQSARELALEECNGSGDSSTPIQNKAYHAVEDMNPEIFYRDNAEFVLTDSAELQEMELYCRVLAERIRELTGKAGVSLEEYRNSLKSLETMTEPQP